MPERGGGGSWEEAGCQLGGEMDGIHTGPPELESRNTKTVASRAVEGTSFAWPQGEAWEIGSDRRLTS